MKLVVKTLLKKINMCVMPRIQLFKQHKGKDYEFIDKVVREHFFAGGTAIMLHKYIGIHEQDNDGDFTKSHTNNAIPETTIQDLLLLENRDRKYSEDIIELRGHYTVGDTDLDLTQFGLTVSNDVLFITFHNNDVFERVGRKLMAGDVFELPHLLDDTGLDNSKGPIPKFYAVEDVTRSSEGFDPGWWPHMIRVKCKVIEDTQEYRDILESENDEGHALQDIISSIGKDIEVSEAVYNQAEEEVPESGYETRHLYYNRSEKMPGVVGSEDGIPSDAVLVGQGDSFPDNATEGQHFLRTDFSPHRLFKKVGDRWKKVEDDKRRAWQKASTLARTYIYNTGTFTEQNQTVKSKDSLTKAAKPKADF